MVDAPKSEDTAVEEATTSNEPEAAEAVENAPEAAAEPEAAAATEPAASEPETSTAEAAADFEAAADGSSEEYVPVAEPTTYRVVTRTDEQVIDGRIEAVETAKSISNEGGQSVLVERTDGRVKMNFRDGSLVDYVIETRKGRTA